MRKFIALMLASLCVLSVAACAPKAPPPPPVITK
jgi:predicted small lipoprotein YifL